MRTIRLCPDWDSVLFWGDAEGCEKIPESDWPVSEGLRTELLEFYMWFSEMFLQADLEISVSDKRLHDARGLELWEKIRTELTDRFRVVYYSGEFSSFFETPEEFKTARR